MSSTIDPAKLKVVDLRSELSSRGLDTKGNKAVLVKRLKDALGKELQQDLPDTSIADTSAEDLDSSQTDDKTKETPKKVEDEPPEVEKMEVDDVKDDTALDKAPEETQSKIESKSENPKQIVTEKQSPEKSIPVKMEKNLESVKSEIKTEKTESLANLKQMTDISDSVKIETKVKLEENGENSETQDEDKSSKSKWSEEEKPAKDIENENQLSAEKDQNTQGEVTKIDGEPEHKGAKRRRSSPSPERSQRRRSRSPIKEDEPAIDNDKVQLSWYDSDLHLQIDKESFLSAKPLTEGAFGYAWAGVRATHGVSYGKVWFEVKVTEELKWEDFSRDYEQKISKDRYKTDHRKNLKRDKDKKDSEKKLEEKSKLENKNDKNEDSKEQDKKPEENTAEGSEKSDVVEQVDVKPDPDGNTEKTETKSDDDSTKTNEKLLEVDNKPEENQQSETVSVESKQKETTLEVEESKPASPEPIPSHLFRVGWSVVNSSLQLGEEKDSYGYESTGRFVTEKKFTSYGIQFGVGDVVGAFLSIDGESVNIRYTVNGEDQSVAVTVPRSEIPEENFSLFPHVLSRNYTFELNFGNKEEPWFPSPVEFENYLYLSQVNDKVSGPVRPENRTECEVLLMCGLPASGKTHWVKEHVSSNVDKRYTVLGNTTLLEKMTVSGEPLKSKYRGRWSTFVNRLQKCLNKLIVTAALRRRNYIIDQTNVFPSAQRRKMRPFEGFKRHAVIVVVGDEEQARRQSLQEAQDGKDVPDNTILEVKAAMSLPEKGEWFEEVTYVELQEAEAKEVVKKYNIEGREAGYGNEKRFRRDGSDRWQYRRNDYRGGKNYRERSYQNQRYDPRGPRQGGWSNQRSGNGWNRDRRDNRRPQNRDWRVSNRDRSNRESRSNHGGSYNRNRQSGGRGQGSWSGGGWGGQGWNQQSFGGGGGGGGYGSQNWGGQWKYGGSGSGSGAQGYYSNWNYYSQYAQQNWNSQK